MSYQQSLKSVLLSLVLMVGFASAYAQHAKNVIIISIDGFRPDFYLDPAWGAINMQEMVKAGAHATGVNSIFPTLTFPNHTAIITGVKSAKHGIYFNAPFGGAETEWYWYSKDIKAQTLWDAAKEHNMTTVSVNWPVSAGAPVTYNIPIIKRKGEPQLQVMKEFSTPGLIADIEENATGKLDQNSLNTDGEYLVVDENVARIAGYLFRKHKPALTTLRLSCTDHFEHQQGREGELVKKAVSGADRAIGTILESVKMVGLADSTIIIICGDHGFVDTHTGLKPNTWLVNAGLMGKNKEQAWKAQFNTTGGSAFLMLKDPNDTQTKKKVEHILKMLSPGIKKLFRVIDRNELDRIGTAPNAALALAAIQGVVFNASLEGSLIMPVKSGTHGYFPDSKEIQTGFIVYGAGIRKGVTIPVMDIIDIAPLVAQMLGIALIGAEGVAYPGVLLK